jgi:U6 snRNA-associated Sm-like protein LSm7
MFTDAADPNDPYKLTDDTRHLGLVVSRGTSIMVICSAEGMEAIANPFLQD